jgi:hypothetical protein
MVADDGASDHVTVTCAVDSRPAEVGQAMLYVTAPALYSVIDRLPLAARGPLHPSPDCPPLAVQAVAPGALHVKVTKDPVAEALLLAVNVAGCH